MDMSDLPDSEALPSKSDYVRCIRDYAGPKHEQG